MTKNFVLRAREVGGGTINGKGRGAPLAATPDSSNRQLGQAARQE